MGVKHYMQVFGKLCPLMEEGGSAVSEVRSSTHLLAGPYWKSYYTQGVTETTRSYGGDVGGFGCDFAVWVLISGLRVLSDSGGL
jgi:hypothetical protein